MCSKIRLGNRAAPEHQSDDGTRDGAQGVALRRVSESDRREFSASAARTAALPHTAARRGATHEIKFTSSEPRRLDQEVKRSGSGDAASVSPVAVSVSLWRRRRANGRPPQPGPSERGAVCHGEGCPRR